MTPVPRVTTRGCYDLHTGRPLRRPAGYRLYPKSFFHGLAGAREITIMVHGFRNDDRGASEKTMIAQGALRRLGYGHPVVGFSYDSNVRGAHIRGCEQRALAVGRRIAEANGRHLAAFLAWFRGTDANRHTRVRLLGHSLGSEVIYGTIMHLYSSRGTARAGGGGEEGGGGRTKGGRSRREEEGRGGGGGEEEEEEEDSLALVESVYLFGSSLPADIQADPKVRDAMDHVIRQRLVNHYAPTDEVLLAAPDGCAGSGGGGTGSDNRLLGLCGAAPGRTAAKYEQVELAPENHRFASYAAVLQSFP